MGDRPALVKGADVIDGPPPPRRTSAGRLVSVVFLVVLLGQLAGASPASAHAELVSTTPANGAVLDRPPSAVTLTFTESVNLVTGGLRLLDATGTPVATPDPVAEGDTIRWPMPADLPDGGYLVNWRVISSDSHPVGGAFSFGVGAAPAPLTTREEISPEAPWQVTLTKLGGYLGFSILAGVIAFTVICWPRGRAHSRTQTLLRVGLVLGLASTAAGLLLQGPYAAGAPVTQVLDPNLWADTMRTGFGAWTQVRLYLLLGLAVMLWSRGALESRNIRWAAGAGVVATAVTFSGTGHAAADGGLWPRAVDSAHVLLAGGWVGGLILLAVTATDRENRPGIDALAAFSRFALLSVVGLLVTGVLNSLLRLQAVSALWDSGYGRLLSVKVAVLLVALAAAAGARTRVRTGAAPRDNSIRVEVGSTVLILVLTAVLASTAPPATLPAQAASAGTSQSRTTVEMSLGEGRTALLRVDPATTGGSRLRLELRDADGRPLDAAAAKLRAELPERDLGPLGAPLTGGPSTWTGDFAFPLAGEWKLTLTVERQGTGLVTAGTVQIR